jgi:regulator of protease activity HflC (stomatin/prohibitin superfamily)
MNFFFNLGLGGALFPLVVLLLILLASAIRILREYERAVVFQLGRFWKVKGPGLVLLIPGLQKMVRVDLRIVPWCSFGWWIRKRRSSRWRTT